MEKAIRLSEKPQLFIQPCASNPEHEPCPLQHRENTFADLKADRIAWRKRCHLILRDLSESSKAFRNVAGLPLLDDAAKLLLGGGYRGRNHPPLVLLVPLPYSAVNSC
jgi:hypothetical protein